MARYCQQAGILEAVDVAASWLPNWRMKTLGGPVWFDTVVAYPGYRIRRNIVTRRYRLLDPDNFRLAWGTRLNCAEEMSKHVDKTVQQLMA